MVSARTKKSSQKSSGRKTAVTSTAKSAKHTSTRSASKRGKKGSRVAQRRVSRPRGQQAIETERVREIQEALIRANYLDGEANGVWDDSTRGALTRFQSDNGWQSKVVPDSRALIKLGLGPNHENVINPETSLISRPPATDPVNALSPGGGTPRR
jgi:peptidoglycan hydrolase-like protein with peptidoglycan-binding domain